jgi:hypothetical protein
MLPPESFSSLVSLTPIEVPIEKFRTDYTQRLKWSSWRGDLAMGDSLGLVI